MRARSAHLLGAVLTAMLLVAAPAYAGKPAPAPSITLSMPTQVQTAGLLTAGVTVSPVEAGRPLQLERLNGTAWTLVTSGSLPSSGTLTWSLDAPSTPGTYSYRVSAPKTKRSAALVSATSTVSVVAPPPPPVISSTTPPVAIIGSAYSFAFTTTDGRAGTWQYAGAAALPAGLTLSSGGVLAGTPSGPAGDVSVPVRFTDTRGQVATASTPLAVRRPGPVVDTSTTPGPASVGRYYEYRFTTADGRVGTWRVTSGSLPQGLALDPDGTVSGTPTSASVPGTTTSFTVTVTDSLAVPSTGTRTTSISVDPGAWSDLVTSGSTTCGMRADGSGWCWGDNTAGTVGGSTATQSRPNRLPDFWYSVDLRDRTACGVKNKSVLFCWGENSSGQVGDGTTTNRATPVQVPGLWRSVRVGDGFTCGVRTDGTGWCWGRNDHGQLGNGTTTGSSLPVQVPGTWGAIWPGRGFACGISGTTASCWGRNDHGQVGDGSTVDRTSPVALAGSWEVLSVGDADHVCGYEVDETAHCWGANGSGQVGDGTTTDRLSPYTLAGPWVSFSVAGASTCGIRHDRTGSCWGQGAGTSAPDTLAGTWRTLRVSPAGTMCGVRDDDSGWCWGANASGQVGNGTQVDAQAPVALTGTWVDVLPGGAATSCGYRPDGTTWCWGANDRLQAGTGITSPQLTPARLP